LFLVGRFGAIPIDPSAWTTMRPFFIASAIIFLVGLADDVRGLGAGSKLLFEFAAAAVVMSSGLLIERITLLGMDVAARLGAWPVTAAWLVGVTNAFNLIDGVDGLAAGITAPRRRGVRRNPGGARSRARSDVARRIRRRGARVPVLQLRAGVDLPRRQRQSGRRLPARRGPRSPDGKRAPRRWRPGVPLMIFALPIADSALALARRATARPSNGRTIRATLRQIAQPDSEHIHHRMLAMGWSVRRTVLILYAITAILSLLALATADVNTP
jgi:UDP-GlcNAc:undecaprenyl-phosphate GlcNAc-1-phosphate transferase